MKKIILPLLSGLMLSQAAHAGFLDNFFGGGPGAQYRPLPRLDFGNGEAADIGNYDDDGINANAPIDPAHMTDAQKDKYRAQLFFKQPTYSSMKIKIIKTTWTDYDEDGFDQFVAGVGRAVRDGVCSSVQECMKNPDVNPFASTDPQGLILYSDCADFPYFLRSYYAYKNGLPFSNAVNPEVATVPYASAPDSDSEVDPARQDNSPYGNILSGRGNSNVPRVARGGRNFLPYLFDVLNQVSTRTFRVGPMSPSAEKSDVYPVAINRVGIRPGSIVHTTGHLYMIYRVDNDGTVFLVDAHPGGWLQAGKDKFLKPSLLDRSRPDQGLGIFRFRNQTLVNAQDNGQEYFGGSIQLETNQELILAGKYSLEQYFGVGTNIVPGMDVNPNMYRQAYRDLSFFDYVKIKLSGKDVILQADKEIKNLMSSLCTEMQERIKDVSLAVDAGMSSQMHPDTIPANIYSANGDWETYSSPSRDSRMKGSVIDIMSAAVTKYKLAKAGGFKLAFKGSAQDYQKSLLTALAGLNDTCEVTYKKSDGSSKVLSYSQVLNRLSKLSFDPYHCPEKRWGASGDEMASCRDADRGSVWYNAEQPIRNTTSKLLPDGRLSVRSDVPVTLNMLSNSSLQDQSGSNTNLGSSKVPYSNLKEYFSSQDFLNSLNR